MPEKSANKQQPTAGSKAEPEADQVRGTARKSTTGNGGTQGRPARIKTEEKPAKTSRRPTDAEKVKELEAGFKELEDKHIRLRAEYGNHIKRTNKEKSELITYAGSHIFRLILPVLDDLRRTVDHARQVESQKDNPVVQGVELIIDKFTELLAAEGVQVFDSVGEAFDPELHEALMTRPSNEHPEGIVVEEYEPGYKYRDKVLRHAKVVVSG